MFLRRFSPITQQLTVNGKVERVLYVPPLEECRATWIKTFHWAPDYTWDRSWGVTLDEEDAQQARADLPDVPF